MKHKIIVTCLSLAITLLPLESGLAYSHSNRYGGSTFAQLRFHQPQQRVRWKFVAHATARVRTHTNEYGGSTSHSAYGGTSHTNTYGGTTSGEAGYGAVHTDPNGATAYHPPDSYYGYHPPTTAYVYHPPAPYYPGCYDCGSTAGAAAVGAAVGMATGAAIASSASAADSQNAYAQGYNAGATNTAVTANAAAANANMAAANANAAAANANIAAAGATGAAVAAVVFDGADRVGSAGRLHHAKRRRRRDVLPVRQHLVQPVVWCGWRVLQGRADAITRARPQIKEVVFDNGGGTTST